MKTGEDARQLGLYTSDCCGMEMIFDKGDMFARCPTCEGLCEWDLLKSISELLDDRVQRLRRNRAAVQS